MSTDWSKYSTPEDTKERARINQKDPALYGVSQMDVGNVRARFFRCVFFFKSIRCKQGCASSLKRKILVAFATGIRCSKGFWDT